MSDLLLRWLNDEVGLSRKVHAFERDFANGYLFGELLSKHGLLEDFSDTFVDENKLASKRTNFFELKAALNEGAAAAIGVRLREEQIGHIMDEDRGSSMRLLFQLRKGLKDVPGQTGQTGQTRQAANKRDATERLAKQPQEEHKERFFDASLKKLKRTEPRLVHELHVKEYYDEHTLQMGNAAAGELMENNSRKQRVQDFRSSRHGAMADHKMRVAEIDYQSAESHQANIRRKHANVERDLVFEKFTIKREMAKIERQRELHKKDCGYLGTEEAHGIGWFEKNLQRIGIDTSEHAGGTEATIQAENAKELYDKMREQFNPAASDLKKECTMRMKKIKESKKASDQAQKERERRRRRVLLKQEEEQAAEEERKQQEALLRQSEAYDSALRYQEEMQFFSEANHKAALVIQRRARGFLARKMLRRRHRRHIKEANAEKSEVALQQMTERALADRTARLEEKRLTAERTKLREASGFQPQEDISSGDEDDDLDRHLPDRGASKKSAVSPLDRSLEASPEPADAETSAVAPASMLVEHVKDSRVSEYLFARGEWGRCMRALPQESDDAKPKLGGIVRWLLEKGPESAASPNLPLDYIPILAISGCPAKLGSLGAGQAAAQKICAELGWALVDPRKVVDECVALARKEEPDWPMQLRMHQLGREVIEDQDARGPEAVVPHATLVEMIFRKIELLASPAPPKPDEEEEPAPDPKKKPKKPPAKKEEEKKEPVRPNGIVILGYLSDLGQQAAWESALRGYLSPYLRINDGEADMQAQLSAILAPSLGESIRAEDYATLPKVTAEPPLKLLRFRYGSHSDLCNRVAAEATNEKAWQAGDAPPISDTPAAPPAGGPGGKAAPKGGRGSPAAPEPTEVADAPPAILSVGYDLEYFNLSNPVDRAWMYEDSQPLVQMFTHSLGSCQDVIPEPEVSEEATESLENALCRQVQDIVSQWQRPMADATPEGAAEEEAPVDQDAEPGADASVEAAESPAEDEQGNMPRGVEPDAAAPWLALPQDEREQMKTTWLESLSQYVKKLYASIEQLHDKTNNFGHQLVRMQRQFLEFLQSNDEKSHVLGDFLLNWPQRSLGQPRDAVLEEIEELSDRLWQFTDRRRAAAVEEHARLVQSGFWEEQACTSLRLASDLYGIEYDRFYAAVALLFQAHHQECPELNPLENLHDFSLERLSSLQELGAWLQGLTTSVAEAPLPMPSGELPEGAPVMDPSADSIPVDADVAGQALDDEGPDAADIMPAGDSGPLDNLRDAILAEKRILIRRLRTVEAWTLSRLHLMRDQLDDAFRRMDDWIRDRVRMENDAIKAAIAQLQSSDASSTSLSSAGDETMSPATARSSRSASKTPKSRKSAVHASPTGGPMRRWRREVLKALEARTLDVEVLIPEKLAVETSAASSSVPMQGGLALARRASEQAASLPDGRWSQDMLRGLLQRLVERTAGAAVCSTDDLLATLLERRLSGFQFDVDLVPPAWVKRSEASIAAFCMGFTSPNWGSLAVDITELLVALTFHERNLPWPTEEALLASRQFLESSASGYTAEELEAYPDVPISEELFLKLPLWNEKALPKLHDEPQNERLEGLKRWLFAVLQCFEDAARPCIPVVGASLSSGAGSICARRLFAYLGMGTTPMGGLQLAIQTLLCPRQLPSEVEEEAEGPPHIFVHHLWAVLYSQGKVRPGGAVAPALDLAEFCRELTKPAEGAEAEVAVDEAEEPPAPETITVPFDEKALLRKPIVVRALCTHGGLLCRKRVLAALFPTGAASGLALHTSAEGADAKGLASMVPTPPPTQESMPGEGDDAL